MEGVSRVTRTRQQARSSYDGMSGWYDLVAGRWEKKYTDAGLLMLDVTPCDRILEIGPGTGQGLADIAVRAGNRGMTCGIDISTGMLRAARSNAKKLGISDGVRLVCGDGAFLPFSDESFDAVFMSFTLELFDTPEIPDVLRECRRVLRPGGRICVVSISREGSGMMLELYEWAHRKFPNFIDCRPIFLTGSVRNEGYHIQDVRKMSMYGLPVETVLAEKPG